MLCLLIVPPEYIEYINSYFFYNGYIFITIYAEKYCAVSKKTRVTKHIFIMWRKLFQHICFFVGLVYALTSKLKYFQ